ncbi:hypothetical protein Lal_00038177 [Lupinus albus]|nr:hypothetical protein Lal_00038177 [Lupinus albus]
MADGGGDETRSYDLHAISKLIGEPEKINSHFSFFFSNSNDDVNQGICLLSYESFLFGLFLLAACAYDLNMQCVICGGLGKEVNSGKSLGIRVVSLDPCHS